MSARKTAVVTGSTKGIGKAVGMELLAQGCFVCFNYASDDHAADMLRDELRPWDGQYAVIKADLSTVDAVDRFAGACLACSDGVDYLVVNAGITDRTPFGQITEDAWRRVMAVNLDMPFFLVQRLGPHIRPGGSILFIGSTLGIHPHSLSLSYGVSKAGVLFLARSLVKVFADRSIRVNALAPGFVDTDWQKAKPAAIRQSIEGKIAVGRFAQPQEVARQACQILNSGYMNGAVIEMDGGYDYK